MKPLRLAVVACAIAVVVGPAPHCARRAGLDLRLPTDPAADLGAARQQTREVEAAWAEHRERVAAGEAVIDRVLAGATGLDDAAADLEAVHRMYPGHLQVVRGAFPGATDRERYRRLVVERVSVRLNADPARRADVLPRLEAELAALHPPASPMAATPHDPVRPDTTGGMGMSG